MSFSRTLLRSMSHRMTLPQLSPTHSQGRILKYYVQNGDAVGAYDPILIVECSADMVTAGFRDHPTQQLIMMVDTQEDGIISQLEEHHLNEWIPVGTELGIIEDGDAVDGDWTWQAYHDPEFEKEYKSL